MTTNKNKVMGKEEFEDEYNLHEHEQLHHIP